MPNGANPADPSQRVPTPDTAHIHAPAPHKRCLRRLRDLRPLRTPGMPPAARGTAPGPRHSGKPQPGRRPYSRRAPKATRPRRGGQGRSSGGALHLDHPGAARQGRSLRDGKTQTPHSARPRQIHAKLRDAVPPERHKRPGQRTWMCAHSDRSPKAGRNSTDPELAVVSAGVARTRPQLRGTTTMGYAAGESHSAAVSARRRHHEQARHAMRTARMV